MKPSSRSQWHLKRPTLAKRVVFAATLAAVVGTYLHARTADSGYFRSDFSLIWFGAHALINGADPYKLVGPGRVFDSPWGALYPATAYVLGIPFTPFSEAAATIAFVTLSTFLLAYGITKDGWDRVPLFLSFPFLWSVIAAQWSIVLTAVLFLPWLGVVAAAKPQAALPVILGNYNRSAVLAALGGGGVLLAISFAFLPSWPVEWLEAASRTRHIRPPIASPGGFFVLLALLRWRTAAARIILLMALMPQALYPYSILPLLAIPNTFREALGLALVTTLGALALNFLALDIHSPSMIQTSGALLIATAFLPATLIVLLRSNGESNGDRRLSRTSQE